MVFKMGQTSVSGDSGPLVSYRPFPPLSTKGGEGGERGSEGRQWVFGTGGHQWMDPC